MDGYEELLGRLGEATDDELGTSRDAIVARLDELAPAVDSGEVTDEQAAEIEALGAAHRAIRAEQDTRSTAAAERATAARSVLDEVRGEPGDGEDGDGDGDSEDGGDGGEPDPDGNRGADPEPGSEPGDGEREPESAADGERVPVTAASRPALGRASARTRARQPQRPTVARDTPRVFAAADTGYAAGQQLDRTQLATAMANRLRAVSRSRSGRDELVHVATFRSGGPAERHLQRGQLDENTRKIDAASSRSALIAAGGYCAPFTPDYSVEVVGSIARPVRDSLTGFTADRGGVMLRPNIDGAAVAPDASGVWTEADDKNVYAEDPADRPPPKPHAVIDCPDMIEASVEGETFQAELSNVMARFDPESTAAGLQAFMVAHARWAENRLLRKLAAGSTHVTWDGVLGAVRDVLAMLDQVVAYKRSVHRLDSDVPLRMILPSWVKNMLRVDVLRAMHTSNAEYFSIADARIAQWFAERNVNITWHMDGEATAGTNPAVPAQRYGSLLTPGQPIPPFPTVVDALLFIEGEWLHLDGGELDLGVVRDSGLIERNRYRTFSEEWVGVVFKGIESLRITAELTPNGASVGTVEPPALSTV